MIECYEAQAGKAGAKLANCGSDAGETLVWTWGGYGQGRRMC